MTPGATDWHGTAFDKLAKVMGSAGETLARSVLQEIGMAKVSSASDLRQFAGALLKRGGFAAAVGALLDLHATMYEEGHRSEPPEGALP
jgi:hypothetical protein